MLEKIKKLFGKGESQLEISRKIARKLHDMPFKYVSEKDENGTETIIGRAGHINIEGEKNEYLCATSGVKTLFKAPIDEMKIWEFMSLDGCVIDFSDADTGEVRSITVYYDKHLT